MVEADTAKLLRREHNKIILRWLGSANPPLNAMLVKSTLDNERCAGSVCLCAADSERPSAGRSAGSVVLQELACKGAGAPWVTRGGPQCVAECAGRCWTHCRQ